MRAHEIKNIQLTLTIFFELDKSNKQNIYQGAAKLNKNKQELKGSPGTILAKMVKKKFQLQKSCNPKFLC